MNNQQYNQPEMEINLKEVIWDLLEQWKAVLITAIAVAMLVCGVKYAKDVKSFEDAAQRKAEAEKQADMSAEERISVILDELSEEDAIAAMNMATQYEWLNAQKNYLKNSILMNTDPTQQRMLEFVYNISGTDQNAATLGSAYKTFVKSNEFIEEMRKLIFPGADEKYIDELIQVQSETANNQGESYGHVFKLSIILLDDTDAEAVSSMISKKLSEQSKKLSDSFATHTLQKAFSEEVITYNYDGTYKKTDTINRINNLQNSIKTAEGNLTEEQKTAANEIYAILMESNETELPEANENLSVDKKDDEAIEEAPLRISKKHALLGFILGTMAYAFVYLVVLIARGRVNYASDVENYTGARLLGEIYSIDEASYKGIGALTHSKIVDKYRYRGKLDEDKQIEKMLDTLGAVCKSAETNELAVFNMTDVVCDTAEEIKKKNIKTRIYSAKEYREEDLLESTDVLLCVSNNTVIKDITKLVSLCNDYDIRIRGSIFTSQI